MIFRLILKSHMTGIKNYIMKMMKVHWYFDDIIFCLVFNKVCPNQKLIFFLSNILRIKNLELLSHSYIYILYRKHIFSHCNVCASKCLNVHWLYIKKHIYGCAHQISSYVYINIYINGLIASSLCIFIFTHLF